MQHNLNIFKRCPNCNSRYESSLINNTILTLTLPDPTYTYGLQHLIDCNINVWLDTTNECQEANCDGKLNKKIQFQTVSKVLVIKLPLFQDTIDGVEKIKNIKLKDLQKTKVSILKNSYKVKSAIFHEGCSFEQGYYYNVLIVDRQCFHVRDSNVQKKAWPRCCLLYTSRCV